MTSRLSKHSIILFEVTEDPCSHTKGYQNFSFFKRGVYSRLFLVPVNDGQMRPVIDLSSQTLNKFIINEHFQMENLSCFKTLLLPGDLTTSADLRDT